MDLLEILASLLRRRLSSQVNAETPVWDVVTAQVQWSFYSDDVDFQHLQELHVAVICLTDPFV